MNTNLKEQGFGAIWVPRENNIATQDSHNLYQVSKSPTCTAGYREAIVVRTALVTRSSCNALPANTLARDLVTGIVHGANSIALTRSAIQFL